MSLTAEREADKPRLRGVLHQWAFFLFAGLGVWLVASQRDAHLWPAAVFAASVLGVFGTSALYHRVKWSSRWYARVRRLDHTMIFGLIMGTYTPIFVVALAESDVGLYFKIAWAVTAAGALMTLLWQTAPKWVRSLVYVGVGWIGVPVLPDIVDALGYAGLSLLVGGGVAYSIGAVFYALKRPNPFPGVFGYHELFHALVVVAVAMHYAAIAFWVF